MHARFLLNCNKPSPENNLSIGIRLTKNLSDQLGGKPEFISKGGLEVPVVIQAEEEVPETGQQTGNSPDM